MTVVNVDPYQQRQKELVPVNMTNGEVCWVHPDLVDDDQPWTLVVSHRAKASKATAPSRKPKGKGVVRTCNVLSAFAMEEDEDCAAMLTDSDEEPAALTVVVAATRSGRNFAKEY